MILFGQYGWFSTGNSDMADEIEEMPVKSELNASENSCHRLTCEFKISGVGDDEQQTIRLNLDGTPPGVPSELKTWLDTEIRRLCTLGFRQGIIKDWSVLSAGQDNKG